MRSSSVTINPKAVAAAAMDSSFSVETAPAANNLSRSQTVQLRRRLAYFSKGVAEQCHAGARTIIAGDVIACQVKRDAHGPWTHRLVERRRPKRMRCSRTIVVPERLPGNCRSLQSYCKRHGLCTTETCPSAAPVTRQRLTSRKSAINARFNRWFNQRPVRNSRSHAEKLIACLIYRPLW